MEEEQVTEDKSSDKETDEWFPNVKTKDRDYTWFPNSPAKEMRKITLLIRFSSKLILLGIATYGIYLVMTEYNFI